MFVFAAMIERPNDPPDFTKVTSIMSFSKLFGSIVLGSKWSFWFCWLFSLLLN